MTPNGLRVDLEFWLMTSTPSVTGTRQVRVTDITWGPRDWIVTVWWGMCGGEIDFSLSTSRICHSRTDRSGWRLSPAAAKAIVAAVGKDFSLPKSLQLTPWWNNGK